MNNDIKDLLIELYKGLSVEKTIVLNLLVNKLIIELDRIGKGLEVK